MTFDDILRNSVERGASDIFIIAGYPIGLKINGEIIKCGTKNLIPAETMETVKTIYAMAGRENVRQHMEIGDDDFALSMPGVGRFRVNIYKQRGSIAAIMRIVRFELPDYKALGIPETVMDLSRRTGGLILVTGPAGSGKSTTLACMLDRINSTRIGHIMTLEDPIEFLHMHKQCIVSQREVCVDTEGYVRGLKAALRQAPDVILIGEMRDMETINIALTAAETGHLVLSTLHTLGAANVIDRIVDVFPSHQQAQARTQLSMVLQAVISQQLLPSQQKGRVAAFEIMMVNTAVRNLIRESKMHQLESVMYAGKAQGMQSMDQCLLELYEQGLIVKDEALSHCMNLEYMSRKLEISGN